MEAKVGVVRVVDVILLSCLFSGSRGGVTQDETDPHRVITATFPSFCKARTVSVRPSSFVAMLLISLSAGMTNSPSSGRAMLFGSTC